MRFPIRTRRQNYQHDQRGIATLAIVLIILVILSISVVLASNVGLFEQRASSNQFRSVMATSAAEFALNRASVDMQGDVGSITSTETGGWLATGAGRWIECSTAAPTGSGEPPDPCTAVGVDERASVYRYVNAGSMIYRTYVDSQNKTDVNLKQASFPTTARVTALLCRLDSAGPTTGSFCSLNPSSATGEFAVTLVSSAAVDGENANAVVRQTLGSYRLVGGGARVPLSASGSITGLGGVEIVASDEASGPGSGVRASIWSPCPVDIEAGTSGSGGSCAVGGMGVGSVITCGLGEFDTRMSGLDSEDQMLSTCGTASISCGCPTLAAGSYSGSSQGTTREGIDILDIDGGAGALPDITYFPKDPYDSPTDPLDDSLFELLFGVDVTPEGSTTVRQTCGPAGNEDCQVYTLHSLGAPEYATCAGVPASTGGLLWVGTHPNHTTNVGTTCNLPAQVGTPGDPAVLVLDGDVSLPANLKVYGIIFVRSSTGTATLSGGANTSYLFGSTMVEGTVNITGMHFIYSKKVIQNIQNSPKFLKLAQLPGSWLDGARPE